MMNKNCKLFWKLAGLAMPVLLGMVMNTKPVMAADPSATGVTDFSAIPVNGNANQISKGVGFYDLGLKPGQKTSIQFKAVNNNATKKKNLDIQLVQGTTADTGIIQYVPNGIKKDNTLKYPFTQLATIDGKKSFKVTLKPAEEKTYTVDLRMPQEKFNGQVLGAIRVSEDKPNANKKGGVSGKVTYALPVILEGGKSELPDLTLNNVDAVNYESRRSVSANLQNTEASTLGSGTLTARITKRGQNETLKSIKMDNQSMAPNSNFNAHIPWGDDNFSAGDYTLYLTYTSKDSKFSKPRTWNFVKNFHISYAKAAGVNYQTTKIPWWIWAIVWILIILIVGAIIYLIYKHRRNKRENSVDEF